MSTFGGRKGEKKRSEKELGIGASVRPGIERVYEWIGEERKEEGGERERNHESGAEREKNTEEGVSAGAEEREEKDESDRQEEEREAVEGRSGS